MSRLLGTFNGHSSRNNVLVKFRDVKFDDASILFLFSAKFSLSIVSSQTHFYFKDSIV